MDIADLRRSAARHAAALHALTAVGLALAARVEDAPLGDEVAERTAAVVEDLGFGAVVATSEAAALAPVLAGIRADLFFGARLLSGAPSGAWREEDARLHEAFGAVSAGFPDLLHDRLAARLDGLAARLARPGAAFLDIGTGVGGLAIAMARRWPAVRVTGVEPLAGVLELARANVAGAHFGHRIELRADRGEDLVDAAAFDLVFVPSAFIPEAALAAVIARGAAALRPAGWLVMASVEPGLEPFAALLARFRIATWGGTAVAADAAKRLLGEAGLGDIRHLGGPEGGPIAFVAGCAATVA